MSKMVTFFNTNSSDLKQKTETANAVVDEFYKKFE